MNNVRIVANIFLLVITIITIASLFVQEFVAAGVVSIFFLLFHATVFLLPVKNLNGALALIVFAVPLIFLFFINALVWLFCFSCKPKQN